VSAKEHRYKHHPTKQHWQILNTLQNIDERFVDSLLHQDYLNAINTFFTPRMIDIIYKKLKSEKLSKTEIEYYSRVIHKRLKALLNITLQRVASTLIISL
jgi:hypothetical protein